MVRWLYSPLRTAHYLHNVCCTMYTRGYVSMFSMFELGRILRLFFKLRRTVVHPRHGPGHTRGAVHGTWLHNPPPHAPRGGGGAGGPAGGAPP